MTVGMCPFTSATTTLGAGQEATDVLKTTKDGREEGSVPDEKRDKHS